MTHDPLCPTLNCIDRNCADCCRCELIKQAREQAIKDCIAAVEARRHPECDEEDNPQCDWCCVTADELGILRSLLEGQTNE